MMAEKFGALQSQRRFRLNVVACAVALCLMVGGTAQAAVVPILDSEGFEAATPDGPDYSLGQLEGQGAHLPNDFPFPGSAPWQASIGTTSTAEVQSGVVASGSQAVMVTRAANEAPGGGRFGVELSGWPDGDRFVCIMWDMLVEDAQGPDGSFGPFFGVEAIDDDGVGLNNGVIGSLGVDATTGDVLYQAGGTGFLTETGASVDFNVWNSFRLDIDFLLNEYTVSLNGVDLATDSFVDGAGLDQITDAPLAALAAAGDAISQAITGNAYFDNYRIVQGKIPEPTTIALGLVSLAAVAGLRRRS